MTDFSEPSLSVRFETEGLIAASDLGRILEELAKAFDRFARASRRARNRRLAVRRVVVGSLVADLVLVGAVSAAAAAQNAQALFGFVGFLADVLGIAQGLKPGRTTTADERLLAALQKPVAESDAQQVNIFVGDGASVTIDRNAISLVRMHREARVDEAWAFAVHARPAPTASKMLAAPTHAELDGKFGTALNVKGQWYVRLEGEGGVLNPVELAHGVEIADETPYQFEGRWEGRSYRINAAHRFR